MMGNGRYLRRDGDDTIDGGKGQDTVYAAAGNDKITGRFRQRLLAADLAFSAGG